MGLPTDELRAIYREFCEDFCAEVDATELARMLGRHTVPLRRERLVGLLFLVHRVALFHLLRVLEKHGITGLPVVDHPKSEAKAVVSAWEKLVLEPLTTEVPIEHQLELISIPKTNDQLELAKLSRSENPQRDRKLIAFIVRFPETYVDAFLRDLLFPPLASGEFQSAMH